MEARKRKGIGFMISGVVFLGVGGALFGTDVTPDWLPVVVQGIGLIANLLGFTTVFPDTD
jgi:ABC-type uncharacterized transport system permease subunit